MKEFQKLSRAEMKKVKGGVSGPPGGGGGGGGGGDSCVSECRSGETCSNGYQCVMVNCMGVSPTTLKGMC